MIRMIIADDNNRDRRIIQEIIDWQSYDINIVGVATNGREALDLACQLCPELVLSDISMPGMSGIELAAELRKRCPDVKILFMSWYNDFEYAKSAVNLNVCGYVMKPIEPDELIAAVLHVLGIVGEERMRRDTETRMLRQIEETLPIVQEEFVRELLFSKSADGAGVRDRADYLRLDFGRYSVAQVLLVSVQPPADAGVPQKISEQYALSYHLKETIRALDSGSLRLFFVRLSGEEFAIVALSIAGAAAQQSILDTASEIYSALRDRYGSTPVIAISNCGALEEVPELYRQARRALRSKFYSSGNPILLYHEIDDRTDAAFEYKVNLAELYDEIKDVLSTGNEDDVGRLVAKYLGAHNAGESDVYFKSVAYSICNILQLVFIESGSSLKDVVGGSFLAWDQLDGLRSLPDLQAWCRDLLLSACRSLNARSNTRDARLVQDIKDIVHRHYAEQITVNDIANVVYIGARQANKIFKRLTGLTIFDYLLEYRIQMAKELLKNPHNRIYRVAELVGYQNKSHFSVVFQKLTGQTPAEYRDNHH